MSSVQIRDVRRSFGSCDALHGVAIPIGGGELVVLLGPAAEILAFSQPQNSDGVAGRR